MSILCLEIKPSKIWLSLLLIFHSLAAVAVGSSGIGLLIKIVLIISVIASLFWQVCSHCQCRKYILQANSTAVAIQYDFKGQQITGCLKNFYYLSPWLVIIYFSIGSKRIYSQFIWADSVSLCLFKQLKRFLILSA